jgi:homoserine kinase
LSQGDAVFNLRKASTLTYALLRDDPDALRCALDDRLHQPYRRRFIHEYDALERLALDSGAYGFIISGSGPTMGCFYPLALHGSILSAFQETITDNHLPVQLHDVALDREGATLTTYQAVS